MHIDLSRKVVVVTGAGRGIGHRIAQRFADEGAEVVRIDRTEESLAAEGAVSNARGYACDVSSERDTAATFASIERDLGRVDVLINNAGIAPSGTLEGMSLADWDATFAVNVRGLLLCTRAAAAIMKRRRWGRILNASSFAAIIPSYAFAAYASSKAAVVSMTRVWASELGPYGITCNAYAPGMVPTQMNRFAEAPAERQRALLNTLSVRRWETADDVANLLVFLASDQAAYVTGTLIDISGGKFATQFPEAAYQAAGL